MIVLKIGGSLLEFPDLGQRLRTLLAVWRDPVSIIVGGGRSADLVREWDRIHQLGDEEAHRLAIEAMVFNSHMLQSVLNPTSCDFVDVVEFIRGDGASPDALPSSWQVSSDAIAALFAVRCKASQLVLLKSAPPPPGAIDAWASAGYVDPWFSRVLAGQAIEVMAIDFLAGASQ